MISSLVHIGPAPRIAVETAGSGPLVLFLHGIGSNRSSWRHQLPVVAKRYQAAAWDVRGYGDSDDYDGPFQYQDVASDIERVLDFFGARAAHLVGLSMGGRIALDFYARHPSRVASLTLADTSAGHPGPASPEQIEAALRLRRKPLLEGKTPADIAPDITASMAGPEITPEARQLLIDNLSALRVDSYLKTLDAVTRFNDFPDYASISVPTLVINGADDPIARVAVVREFAARIPNHRLEVFDRTGHVSNVEQPEAFNAALLRFLDEQTGQAP